MLSEGESGKLREFLSKNQKVIEILKRAPQLKMKNWYLGAGCIAQTVWNALHGFPPEGGIKDYDLVYFDSSDLSYDAENLFVEKSADLFEDLHVKVEVKNEACIHLWYKEHFGRAISPYQSAEDAISTWPTTATSIGVTIRGDGRFATFAPFGLSDLFALVVRPNRRQATKEIYMEKTKRWVQLWPKLKVIPWDDPPAFEELLKGRLDGPDSDPVPAKHS